MKRSDGVEVDRVFTHDPRRVIVGYDVALTSEIAKRLGPAGLGEIEPHHLLVAKKRWLEKDPRPASMGLNTNHLCAEIRQMTAGERKRGCLLHREHSQSCERLGHGYPRRLGALSDAPFYRTAAVRSS